MKIRTFFNTTPFVGKKTIGKSMTVPNQAQSVTDIILRHTANVPMPEKECYFFGDRMPVGVGSQSYDPLEVYAAEQKLRDEIAAKEKEYQELLKRNNDLNDNANNNPATPPTDANSSVE